MKKIILSLVLTGMTLISVNSFATSTELIITPDTSLSVSCTFQDPSLNWVVLVANIGEGAIKMAECTSQGGTPRFLFK
jgi:hypothetical protein